MAPDYVIRTLKYWYREGIKTSEEIRAMVPAKISQTECNEILGGE